MRPVASESHPSSELRTPHQDDDDEEEELERKKPVEESVYLKCRSTSPASDTAAGSIGCRSEVLLLGHAQEEGIRDSGGMDCLPG